jgi:hypothetical protein
MAVCIDSGLDLVSHWEKDNSKTERKRSQGASQVVWWVFFCPGHRISQAYNSSNSMPDISELEKYYKTLTDRQLLNLRAEGGFTAEADQVLSREFALRRLGSGEVKNRAAAAERSKLRDEVVERGGGKGSLGLQFFGKSFLNPADREANIQVRTKWFTISGIPLVPIASYRFKAAKDAENSFPAYMQRSVINRVPIYWPQAFLTFAKTVSVIIGAGLLIVGFSELWDALKHLK